MEELTIPRGQDILPALEQYVLSRGWNDVGSRPCHRFCQRSAVCMPCGRRLPLRVAVTPCHGAAEILSFTGEIMTKDKMDPELEAVYPNRESPLFVHIHASCARAGGQVMGGGLRGGKAFRSLRVFLRPVRDS
jgi:hypothetical protein